MARTVAIVGGGIIGMSIAWRLAQAGFSVTVFEKNVIGAEASWAGAGMLAPAGEFDIASPLAQLAIESRDLYPRFIQELREQSGLAIDFQETGAIDLAYSEAGMFALEERAERQASFGIPSRRLSGQQIAVFWPRVLKDNLSGGYFYPGDASVNPREVIAALRVACLNRNVSLVEHQEIKRVDPDAFDVSVIAAGAWSGSIEVAGLPPLPASEPVRGHLIGYKQPEQVCNTIIRCGHTYLLQRSNGLLIVGASMERVGFDRSIDSAAIQELERQAAQVMPHLQETTPSEVWNGFRPGASQLHFGRLHNSRIYLAYGHFRNGILLAPITAQRMVQEITAQA